MRDKIALIGAGKNGSLAVQLLRSRVLRSDKTPTHSNKMTSFDSIQGPFSALVNKLSEIALSKWLILGDDFGDEIIGLRFDGEDAILVTKDRRQDLAADLYYTRVTPELLNRSIDDIREMYRNERDRGGPRGTYTLTINVS
jgi:hypothetical protein